MGSDLVSCPADLICLQSESLQPLVSLSSISTQNYLEEANEQWEFTTFFSSIVARQLWIPLTGRGKNSFGSGGAKHEDEKKKILNALEARSESSYDIPVVHCSIHINNISSGHPHHR